MTALSCGTILGSYQLLTPLGHGGAATVWVARQDGSKVGVPALVAVKVLRSDVSDNPAFWQRFLSEANLLSGIRHPHVVSVYDAGQAATGELFTAMEWVHGESLHRIIAAANRKKPVPSELAARIVADVADGLVAVHMAADSQGNPLGIVHCDISPQNILVGLDGSVRLVDFGVASTQQQLETPDKKVRGKPAYMAPEQTRGARVDQRSDLFSLGVVLFELCTGRRLFRGANQAETVKLVRECRVPLPSELLPNFPPHLEAIILRALQSDPIQRFQSASAFRDAILDYLRRAQIIVPREGIRALLKRVVGEEMELVEQRIRACILALDV
jgi:serine/threonine protein kinase